MIFNCKSKWYNYRLPLENVWWLVIYRSLEQEHFWYVVGRNTQDSIIPQGIIAYSCVPNSIHLSDGTPTSSGLASEEGVYDTGSSIDAFPWKVPSGFLTTCTGWSQTG